MKISRRVGYSSPVLTLCVYGHLFENDDSEAVAGIDAAFAKRGTDQ
jgi:hypothetical protein